jgi:hypothetical protein
MGDRSTLFNGFAANGDLNSPVLIESASRFCSLAERVGLATHGWKKHWSRKWEFPWVLEAATRWTALNKNPGKVRTLESGSGLTELPFAMASAGNDVVGIDLDTSYANE